MAGKGNRKVLTNATNAESGGAGTAGDTGSAVAFQFGITGSIAAGSRHAGVIRESHNLKYID